MATLGNLDITKKDVAASAPGGATLKRLASINNLQAFFYFFDVKFLTKWLSNFTICVMKTKKDTIRTVGLGLQRILNLRSQLEEKPICFDAGIEITPREIHTVQAIGQHKSINVKELGDYFGVTKSAASQMVKKLTEKGFVKKINPPHSNKELHLTLTELGKRAFRAHERFHAAHMDELIESLQDFSAEDIAKTSDLLKVIETVMEKRLLKV